MTSFITRPYPERSEACLPAGRDLSNNVHTVQEILRGAQNDVTIIQ